MSPDPVRRNQQILYSIPEEDCRLNIKMTSDLGDTQVEPPKLACLLKESVTPSGTFTKLLIVDCRRFLDYNTSHIRSAINVCCSKLVRRRLQENKMSAFDLLFQQVISCGLISSSSEVPNVDVILYDQQTMEPMQIKEKSMTFPVSSPVVSQPQVKPVGKKKTSARSFRNGGPAQMDDSTFLCVLMEKLCTTSNFSSVKILKGGFLDFQAQYPELCEGAVPIGGMPATPGRGAPAKLSLTSLSQPCLPVSSQGPTRILPFLYLGSQQDAMDPDTLKKYGIDYVINLSISCPKPEFLNDTNFLRIAVNDSYTEKLLPHFEKAFDFLDKVREANACVLVHCLAGISRSPTVAIAYIMRHLHMSSEDAYRYIKEKRPSISPNFNFLGQLLEYEKRLNEYREKNISEQLKGSLRKVLVPPTPGPKTSPPILAEGVVSVEAPVTFSSPPNSARASAEIGCMKRSFSCPIKIHKTGKEMDRAKTLFEMSESPSSQVNGNGKRSMREISDVEMVPAAESISGHEVSWPKPSASSTTSTGTSQIDRPRGLGGLKSRRGLNIPNPVHEDLPSPSTELSKLTFGCGQAASTTPKICVSQDSGNFSSEGEEIGVEEKTLLPIFPCADDETVECATREVQKSTSSSCNSEIIVSAPKKVCATNPFFANLPPVSKPTVEGKGEKVGYCTGLEKKGETSAVTTALPPPTVSVSWTPAEKPRYRAPGERSADNLTSLSVENPLFPNKKVSGKAFRFGAKCARKTSKMEEKAKKTENTKLLREQQLSGISQRISQFFKKSNWPHPGMPLLGSAAAVGLAGESGNFSFFSLATSPKPPAPASGAEGVVRSKTCGGLTTKGPQVSPPPKSKSESAMLYTMCEDLESPESGFVESPMADTISGPPYGRDPERESISSASSLEIAVN